jgi:hypothetical protein
MNNKRIYKIKTSVQLLNLCSNDMSFTKNRSSLVITIWPDAPILDHSGLHGLVAGCCPIWRVNSALISADTALIERCLPLGTLDGSSFPTSGYCTTTQSTSDGILVDEHAHFVFAHICVVFFLYPNGIP